MLGGGYVLSRDLVVAATRRAAAVGLYSQVSAAHWHLHTRTRACANPRARRPLVRENAEVERAVASHQPRVGAVGVGGLGGFVQ